MPFTTWLTAFLLTFALAFGLPAPQQDGGEIAELFHDSVKRDTEPASSPLLKLPLFNPLFGPFAKPLTPADVAASNAVSPGADPNMMAAYFKAKKDEFLTKLYSKMIMSSLEDKVIDGTAKRQAADDTTGMATPTDPTSFFMSKKMDFLSKLFKAINASTVAPPTDDTILDDTVDDVTTTPKPTIVPPGFWISGFPLPKSPKPTKAPKPTKPPKAKKVLKDALDSLLLQSILADLGVDTSNITAGTQRRAAVSPLPSKKVKAKKVKPVEEVTEYHIPTKIDPEVYKLKASDYLDKIFKALNKSTEEEVTGDFIQPKATVVPLNFWTEPSSTEYTSKLDAFLDLLTKSMSATPTKPKKSSNDVLVRRKRSAFLDELLHRIPPSTTPPPTSDEPASEVTDTNVKRSLFKPFGLGYWMPSYLYAARVAAYMDALNSMGGTPAETEVLGPFKRAASPTDDVNPKDAAVNLIIEELTELKDEIVAAFTEGVKAQKAAATVTPKPVPAAAKAFKKPWGPKATPTPDPVAPIQKRIDLLNDVFDKLVTLEKTLLLDPTAAPSTTEDTTDTAEETTTITSSPSKTKPKPTIVPPSFWVPDSSAPMSPDYYVSKTQEFLQKLYDSKSKATTSEEDD